MRIVEDGVQKTSAGKRLRNIGKKNRGFEGYDDVGKNNTSNVDLASHLMKPKYDIGLG